jgi:hypothetical protein
VKRDERGQTAAELLGVLALVALVVAVLATSGIGRTLTGTVESVVCSIASGGDCGDSEQAASSETHVDSFHHRDPGGSGGPTFGTGPFPVPGIPWDGSVSYGESSTDEPGVHLDASIQYDRSKCRLDSEGNPTVELGVTGTLRAGAMNEKENKGKTAGVSVDAYVGRDVAYKVSTDPERAERISDRRAKPPNPVDPTSIPEGTAITLDESTYTGLNLGASYGVVQAELGYSRGRKVSAAVQRTDEHHVQLTVGDADVVQNSLVLALGTDDANVNVGSEKSLANGKTRQVDIDLRTPEGQRAYQGFIKTGVLPHEGKGVANPRTTNVLDYNASTKLGGKLAGLEADLIASDGTGQIALTEKPDGTASVTQFGREGEVGLTHQFTVGPDGRPGRSRYSLRLQDADQQWAGALAKQAGLDYDDRNHDITVNFDDIDMRRMRSAAIDQLAMNNPDHSRDEIKRLLAAGEADGLASPDRSVLHIAMQTDPLEIAKIVATQGGGDSTAAAQWLFDFGEHTTMARHGSDAGRLGDHPEDAAIDDPKLSAPGCGT